MKWETTKETLTECYAFLVRPKSKWISKLHDWYGSNGIVKRMVPNRFGFGGISEHGEGPLPKRLLHLVLPQVAAKKASLVKSVRNLSATILSKASSSDSGENICF